MSFINLRKLCIIFLIIIAIVPNSLQPAADSVIVNQGFQNVTDKNTSSGYLPGFAEISVGKDHLGNTWVLGRKADGSIYQYRVDVTNISEITTNGWQNIPLPKDAAAAKQINITSSYQGAYRWMIGANNKLYKGDSSNLTWQEVAFVANKIPLKISAVDLSRAYVLSSDKMVYISKNTNLAADKITWQEVKITLPTEVKIENIWAGTDSYTLQNMLYVALSNKLGHLIDISNTATLDLTKPILLQASIYDSSKIITIPKYKKVVFGNAISGYSYNTDNLFAHFGLSELPPPAGTGDGKIYNFRFYAKYETNKTTQMIQAVHTGPFVDFGWNSDDEWWCLFGASNNGNYSVYRKASIVMLPKSELEKLIDGKIVNLKHPTSGKYLESVLKTDNNYATLATGTIPQNIACKWTIERYGKYIKFKNNATGQYLMSFGLLQGTSISDAHLQNPFHAYMLYKFNAPNETTSYFRDSYSWLSIEDPAELPITVTTNALQKIYTLRDASTKTLTKFIEIPGGTKMVAAGRNEVWALAKPTTAAPNVHNIYRLNNNNSWQKMPGTVSLNGTLSVGIDDGVWMNNYNGTPYRWNFTKTDENKWVSAGGEFKMINVAKDSLVCGIGKDDQVYANQSLSGWKKMGFLKAKWISATDDGTKYWAVGTDGKLYRWVASILDGPVWNGYWVLNPGIEKLMAVLAIDTSTVLVIKSNEEVFINASMTNGVIPADKWQPFYPKEKCTSFSISLDNNIWLTKQDGSIWTTDQTTLNAVATKASAANRQSKK